MNELDKVLDYVIKEKNRQFELSYRGLEVKNYSAHIMHEEKGLSLLEIELFIKYLKIWRTRK